MKTSWIPLAGLLLLLAGCGAKPSTSTNEGDVAESADTTDEDEVSTPERANGTIGPWRTLGAMPTPRANHCSVAIGKWLLVIGGNHRTDTGFQSIDEIYAAHVNPDGTLGNWVLAGRTPSPVFECVVTKHDKTVYLVDGIYDDSTKGAQVWSADFSTASGRLGTFKSMGPLPPDVRILYSAAFVKNGALYAMQAQLPQSGDRIATWQADLSKGLGAWHETDWVKGFRGHPQYARSGNYIFTLGGYAGDNNQVVTDVYGVQMQKDGSLGQGFSTAPMLTPTAFGTVVAVDDYLYSIGGKPAIFTAGVTGVSSVHIGPNGQLETWQAQGALPQGRTNHTTLLSGNFVYVLGGGFDGPGLDSVLSAQVRF
jgi:Kelch motif